MELVFYPIADTFPYQWRTQEDHNTLLKQIFSVDVSLTDILPNDEKPIQQDELRAILQAFEEVLHLGEASFAFDGSRYQLGPQQFKEDGDIFYPITNEMGQEIATFNAGDFSQLKAKLNSMALFNLLTVEAQQSFRGPLAERDGLDAVDDISRNLRQVLSQVLNAVKNGRLDLNKMEELAGIFNHAESIEGLENSPQLHRFSQALDERVGNQRGRRQGLRQPRQLVFPDEQNGGWHGPGIDDLDMPSLKRRRFK